MSLLKQIEDKGAVLEWCPVSKHGNLVALGTKDSTGAGFDEYGGELEIHSLDFSDSKTHDSKLIGKTRALSRFSSIAWSEMALNSDEYPYGLIAGGMTDGCIHIWNPAKLIAGEEETALLASIENHQGPIYGLHFNPHKESSHLLASGGSDGEVFITSLENPAEPSVFVPAPPPNNAKHSADITKVAWNSQVAHIVASAAQNGSCYVWDLRQKRAWCELRDPAGGVISDIAWNPDQGLHLITAGGDDKNPVLKLWDLRSSTSLPMATLTGHTEGILSISWCPSDPSFLMSCGKDNRTILWDLYHLQPVYELPTKTLTDSAPQLGAQGMFGGLANSAGQRRYHVSWSRRLPAVVSTSSFDRKVQFFSLTGVKSSINRAPKWLRKPVGAAFGFGGKLVSFGGKSATKVRVSQVLEDEPFISASDRFHEAVAKSEYQQFCASKAVETSGMSAKERQVWSLMNVICFGSNAREELLTHLGFDSSAITSTAQQYVASLKGTSIDEAIPTPPVAASLPPPPAGMGLMNASESGISAADMFGGDPVAPPGSAPTTEATEATSPPSETAPVVEVPLKEPEAKTMVPAEEKLTPEETEKAKELLAMVKAGEEAEPTIRKAIIVGNFEAAVDCCLQAGLLAEALLLAQCGDQALRLKTQTAFFEKERKKHPFLNVLHAVIRNELMNYVLSSDLVRWKESLALLSTYGKSEEFPGLCEALAARLENEAKDYSAATMCYMCAANVKRTVQFWTDELKSANTALGRTDTIALQNYVEKVVVFTHANPVDSLGPECSSIFAKYAELLACQGRLSVALGYLKNFCQDENILIDRLYHAGEGSGGSAPAFPFSKQEVGVTVSTTPAVQPAAAVSASATAAGKTAKKTTSAMPSTVGSGVQKTQTEQATGVYVLPPGWIQLIDPTSNHPYYVDQATGQSQWEPPAMAPPAPSPRTTTAKTLANPMQASTGQAAYPGNMNVGMGAAAGSAFMGASSQMGMGAAAGFAGAAPFGAAANAGLNQPAAVNPVISSGAYGQQQATPVAVAPTPMVMPTNTSVAPAAVTPATVAPVVAPEMAVPAAAVASAGDLETVQGLTVLIETLAAYVTSPAEKKQMSMVQAALKILLEQVNSGVVAPDVMQKLATLVESCQIRNFSVASQIQTDLANTVWGQHKDWLKGLKIFIQLAAKK